MPNTLTALTPVLFSAAQEVSNEPFGIVSAINANFDDKGVAVGDTVNVPFIGTRPNVPFTASNVTSTGRDTSPETIGVTISKSQKQDWHLTGEQLKSLQNGGDNASEMARQWAANAMRALRNEAEADAGLAVKIGASRVVGVAGTAPFATGLNELTAVRKVLRDNGAPMADLQLCVNTDASLNLLNLGVIQQAQMAGTDEERRTGVIKRQFGFQIRETTGAALHVKGSGTGYVTNGATAQGGRTVALSTGTGTVLAGDVVSFAADGTNRYVVGTGVAAPGNIILGRPGARITIPTGNALTVGNNYTPSFAFERNSVVGIMRPPIMPANPTIQQSLISDQYGMTYLMLEIAQYGQITWEMHLAWGFRVVQGEHVAMIIG